MNWPGFRAAMSASLIALFGAPWAMDAAGARISPATSRAAADRRVGSGMGRSCDEMAHANFRISPLPLALRSIPETAGAATPSQADPPHDRPRPAEPPPPPHDLAR